MRMKCFYDIISFLTLLNYYTNSRVSVSPWLPYDVVMKSVYEVPKIRLTFDMTL